MPEAERRKIEADFEAERLEIYQDVLKGEVNTDSFSSMTKQISFFGRL